MNSASHQDMSKILDQAIPYMEKYTIPPTPENYAVVYSYFSEGNEDLKKNLDSLVQEKETVEEADIKSFYDKFVNKSEEEKENIQKVEKGLQAIAKNITQMLSNASTEANNFGKSLSDCSDTLSGDNAVDSIDQIIKQLSTSTESMSNVNAALLKEISETRRETESLRMELEKTQEIANTDSLTGIANRESFMNHIENQYAEGVLAAGEHCIIMADIDHFKKVNDTHGHLTGDKVIKAVAQILKKGTKGIDLPARFGGEEFIVYLPFTDINGAKVVAENIRKMVASCKIIRPKSREAIGQITLSLGVSQISGPDEVYETISKADEALYEAKRGGRNKVVVK